LLELAALEQGNAPTYLKYNASGGCHMCRGVQQGLQRYLCCAIYAAAPCDIIHYCDTGKKGFDAPDEDKLKPLMECVLVLYLPCYEKRLLEYETETGAAKGGCRIG
jgi:hypothetical protein